MLASEVSVDFKFVVVFPLVDQDDLIHIFLLLFQFCLGLGSQVFDLDWMWELFKRLFSVFKAFIVFLNEVARPHQDKPNLLILFDFQRV